MNVFIRVDASIKIGIGHVMRCLTLAEKLKECGNDVTFICRKNPSDMTHEIKKRGFKVIALSYLKEDIWEWMKINWVKDAFEIKQKIELKNSNLLIVDHYAIDKKWEKNVRDLFPKIMVIDDLANRKHDCDILLDQNYYPNFESRYLKLVSKDTILLLGPKYFLLRDEFKYAFREKKDIKKDIKNILINFGGTDPTGETKKLLEVLRTKEEKIKNINFLIVVGANNKNKKEIFDICEKNSNFEYFESVNFMGELMNKVDLSIGAGGTSIWERIYSLLPSLVILTARNQFEVSNSIESFGCHKITSIEEIEDKDLFLFNYHARKEQYLACKKFIKRFEIENIVEIINEVFQWKD